MVLAIGWGADREVALSRHVRRDATVLLRPPLIVALGFVLWVWFCAIVSPAPGIALTGSLTELNNGAYEYLLLFVVFVMVYAQVRADPVAARRIAGAVVASGVVLGAVALMEVLTRQPVLFRGSSPPIFQW